MRYVGLVVIVLSIIIGLFSPPASHSQGDIDFSSTVLPESRDSLFVLSVAELRFSIRRLENFLFLAGDLKPCEECEAMGPDNDKLEAQFANEEAELDTLKKEIKGILDDIDYTYGEIEDIVEALEPISNMNSRVADMEKKLAGAWAKSKGKGEAPKQIKEMSGEIIRYEEGERKFYKRLQEEILGPRFKKISNLQQKLASKFSAKNEKGFTWIARAMIADNADLAKFIRNVGGVDGLLQAELLEMAKAGDTEQFKKLMKLGADVYHKPGSYSALSYAKQFGSKDMELALIKNGAKVEAPWDPHRVNDRKILAKMLKAQTERVQNFAATLSPDSLNDPQVATFAELLDKLVCKTKCLTKNASQMKVATGGVSE